MAINQATNITPSLSGAFSLGNGVVDALNDMTVSWQVNGQSPMLAYRVIIYQNNAASTQLYSTGKVTLSNPFYGKDALGNYQFFSFQISAADLASAGIVNGGEYKLTLTQWWGSTDAESVTQSSAAAFITRKEPYLHIDTIPSPVQSRSRIFTATYTQAQGDALNWVRWQIAAANDKGNPIYDSGNIYTALLSCTYDGFFSGADSETPNYSIRCQVQTVNGVEADTGWVDFTVYYTVSPLTGLVQTRCLPNLGGIEVSWPKITSIPGVASGAYAMESGKLFLNAGATVTWSHVNGAAMNFAPPFSVLWKGKIEVAGTLRDVFRVVGPDGTIAMYADGANGKIGITQAGADICTAKNVRGEAEVTLILTPGMVYWRITQVVNGLFPAETLYPSETLYPDAGQTETVLSSEEIEYTQGAVTSAVLVGKQTADYFELLDGEPAADVISEAWQTGTYTPEFGEKTLMLADFTRSLNAGLVSEIGVEIDGFIVYRQRANERIVRVGDFTADTQKIIDFTIRNQKGPYKWSVYPKGGSSFATDALESEEISPCFWDWALISAVDSGHGYCTVQGAYRFRLNVESSAMSNNNEPSVYQNFTPYPTVMRAPQNYKSGTLSGLIGSVSNAGGRMEYQDSTAARDAIMRLSVSGGRLFLRNRKGDLLEVRISGPISMETMDNAISQAQTASVPWVEIADASGVSLVAFSEPGQEAGA